MEHGKLLNGVCMDISNLDTDDFLNWFLDENRSRHPKDFEYSQIYSYHYNLVVREKYERENSTCDMKGLILEIFAHRFR